MNVRSVSIGAILWASVSSVAAGAQSQPAPAPTHEAAVRAVVARYVEAREARDQAAVAAVFTADADQLVSSGEWRTGREQVVSGSLESTQRTGGSREILVERVRFLGDGVAIADGRYTIRGLETGERRMWTTFVMTRTDQGWRIAAIATCSPQPSSRLASVGRARCSV
jgi:uncharacterized protein (TIGR02246 family)